MLLTLQQTSEMVGVSEMTIRRYIKQKKIKANMVCNRYLINQEDIPKIKAVRRPYTKRISTVV